MFLIERVGMEKLKTEKRSRKKNFNSIPDLIFRTVKSNVRKQVNKNTISSLLLCLNFIYI